MKKIALFSAVALLPAFLFVASYLLIILIANVVSAFGTLYMLDLILNIIAVVIVCIIPLSYIVFFFKKLSLLYNSWILPAGFALIPAFLFIYEYFDSSVGYFAKYTTTVIVALLYALPLFIISTIIVIIRFLRAKKSS